MTKEQWLVYLYSIYPQGGFSFLVGWCLAITLVFLSIAFMNYQIDYEATDKGGRSLWVRLGKWKLGIPTILLVLLFLASLVPKKDYFIYIIATPYLVESGKSIADSLNDEESKAYKLNKMLDKALDKALLKLDEKVDEVIPSR